jgi:hypothetical protein
LTRFQLRDLAGLSAEDLDYALQHCRQFVEGQWPDGPFRIFHLSLRDFLLYGQENLEFHIDPAPMHAKIADHYLAALDLKD